MVMCPLLLSLSFYSRIHLLYLNPTPASASASLCCFRMASMLMNTKRALFLASRKWRKTKQSNEGEKTRVATKGHFVVYTIEGRRFVVPLAYLDSAIFRELFRKSEDEFGHHCDRPITLPCDANFMECVVELLRR